VDTASIALTISQNASAAIDLQIQDFLSNQYTASDVLTKIKSVDGADSGLDADLLRGLPADFTAVKAENGYQKLPSGLIIQWAGLAAGTTSGTWPIAFPNACLSALPGAVIEGTNNYAFTQVYVKTTTGFKAQALGAATGAAPEIVSYAYLVVGIGY